MVGCPSPKSEVVAMLSKFNHLSGNKDLSAMTELDSLRIFSKIVIDFFDDLSKRLLKDNMARNFPDLITFGFHIRKANINIIRKSYSDLEEASFGRGLAYHIGPSNVPMNFAFSMFYSLLAGNSTIVRLPSMDFPQVSLLIKHINQMFYTKKHDRLRSYLSLIRFDKSSGLSSEISKICFVRAIWGSDETVQEILAYPKKIKCKDLVFPARLSCSVISCARVLSQNDDVHKLAESFFADTFSMDQNACSSPTQVFFMRDSENVVEAKNYFWKSLKHVMISQKYEVDGAMVMNREVASVNTLMEKGEGLINRRFLPFFHNVETRINARDVMRLRVGGGLFFEYEIDNLQCLSKYLSEEVQTITTHKELLGHLRKSLNETCPGHVDRVVPFGRALDFGPVWDGYDLIREMSQLKM